MNGNELCAIVILPSEANPIIMWCNDAADERRNNYTEREWVSRRDLMQQVDEALEIYERHGTTDQIIRIEINPPSDHRDPMEKFIQWMEEWMPYFPVWGWCINIPALLLCLTPWFTIAGFYSPIVKWTLFSLLSFYLARAVWKLGKRFLASVE